MISFQKLSICLLLISEICIQQNNLTVKNSLFGPVILTKNVNFDKYQYSGYGIGFDRRGSFLFQIGGFGRNLITFGVGMSSSVYIDNRKKTF